MGIHYTIKNIDVLILFGKRMVEKRKIMSKEHWNKFINFYFCGMHDNLEYYMSIAQNENLAREIFIKQPMLSIRGLYKEIQCEISSI